MAWAFGNGQTAKSSVVNVKYTESGTYTVALTAIDDSNVAATFTKDVTVTR